MPTDDDLPLNVAGNAYDPLFAGRIAALGGGSGGQPAPRPPRTSGGGGGWGGWVVAIIVGVNVMRGCAHSTSSDYGRDRFPNNLPAEPFPDVDQNRQLLEQLEQFRKARQQLDDNRPGQEKPAGNGGGPEQEGP